MNKFSLNHELLGRILGPTRGQGSDISRLSLKANGNVVPRQKYITLNTTELYINTEKKKFETFDALI